MTGLRRKGGAISFGTLRSSRPLPSRAGFTLMELIIVLTIVTILLGAVSPVFVQSLRLNRCDQAAQDLIACLKFAQESAITQACEHRVYLDDREGSYWVMRFSKFDREDKIFEPVKETYAGKRRLPDLMEMDRPDAREDRKQRAQYIAFYPNGACDYATIRLKYGDHGRTVIETKGSLGTFDIKEREAD